MVHTSTQICAKLACTLVMYTCHGVTAAHKLTHSAVALSRHAQAIYPYSAPGTLPVRNFHGKILLSCMGGSIYRNVVYHYFVYVNILIYGCLWVLHKH